MDALQTAITVGRVLFCFALVGCCLPAAAASMARLPEPVEIAAGIEPIEIEDIEDESSTEVTTTTPKAG